MTLHHLDGGAMRPPLAGRFLNDAGLFANHVVAAELPDGGVALVDTGLGLDARRHPAAHLGGAMAAVAGADRDPDGAVVRQLEALGWSAGDVRHVFMTHLDFDHAAGLPDVPDAVVHVHRDELAAARAPTRAERLRYVEANWAHGPRWEPFGEAAPDTELFGLPGHTLLDGLVVALPLPGHTRGHTGYAVRDGDGWLLHAGDAFYDGAALDPDTQPGRLLRLFARGGAVQPGLAAAQPARLRTAAQDPAVRVVCTHDPAQLARAQAAAAKADQAVSTRS